MIENGIVFSLAQFSFKYLDNITKKFVDSIAEGACTEC